MGQAEAAHGGAADGRSDNTISGGIFFHAVIQGRDITVQLPPRITPALSGLPAPSAAFTGRDQEVDRLLRELAPDVSGTGAGRAAPVTAVSGLAGIGKTELAVQTAARARKKPGWFPGGVLFTDLSGYDPERSLSPERALEGLLRALGMTGDHIPNGLQDRQRLYRSVLAAYADNRQRILVVVDNARTAEQARPLLPTDGVTAALVTSRHTLDGLDARLHDLGVLGESASVALLDQALRRARGEGDTRVADDPEAATTIARLCAGLPLALRIVAALLAAAPARPGASLAAALRAGHTRLDKLSRPDRAVRAAFDLSYRLLDGNHARLFRLLPLNSGPDLSTEAAAHLAGTDPDRAEELLQHLADAHLVEPGQVWGRWRMHDLVRLFADEAGQARATDDGRDAAVDRLLDHYLTTAQAADTHLQTTPGLPLPDDFTDRDQALEWLDAERGNLVAAATAAPAHHAAATGLALALGTFLDLRRYANDWVDLSTVAVAVCREAGDRHNEKAALDALGRALLRAGRSGEAVDTFRACLALCRAAGDRHAEAMTLSNLGQALASLERFVEAVNVLSEAAGLFGEMGDSLGGARVLGILGPIQIELGGSERAVGYLTEAVAHWREVGDRHAESVTLDTLGLALVGAREFGEGVKAHADAVALFRECGDPHGEAHALNNLGAALIRMRRFDEAADSVLGAARLSKEIGYRRCEAMALANFGQLLLQKRSFDKAVTPLTTAAGLFRETGDRRSAASTLNLLGQALAEEGRFDEAADVGVQDASLCRELGDRHGEGIAWKNVGLSLCQVRRCDEAVEALSSAAALFRETGDRRREAEVRVQAGLARAAGGRPG
ncbi:NB-ARC domain-containing protein [Streptomyces zhaozhouensis]|uniref:NB-ARC domain-containing protein n=1 Tax=Streptomyces zhaozhouensis TaxID=1300267 RepID=A0A286DWA6_9ACTN|nr:tetratricopeptide repeat protein [Streptomyces zhaozhouensis]SOD62959.1 NB-ARC domain-containing protein [Streptomyces zhaozhouensis]